MSHGAVPVTPARLLALVWFLAAVRLAGAQPSCPVPDHLALRDLSLPAARASVLSDHRLAILTLGGAHTAGVDAGSRAAAWPARLEDALAKALPRVQVSVLNDALPGNTAADIPPGLTGLIEKTGARLVIWGPGGRNLPLRLDANEYQRAVQAGIDATRHAGADVILLDTTYLPSPTRMVLIEPYRERLRKTAIAEGLPFFLRYDLMVRWSKDGILNLEARDPAEQRTVAEKLFACIAASLARPIAASVR